MIQSFFWLLVGCLLFLGNGGQFCFIIIALLREVLITRKPSWTQSSQSLKRIQKPKKPVIMLFWHYLLRDALSVFFKRFCHVYHLVKVPNLYFMKTYLLNTLQCLQWCRLFSSCFLPVFEGDLYTLERRLFFKKDALSHPFSAIMKVK